MTKFDKNKFSYHGGYLMYNDGISEKFIARFKYRGTPFKKTVFLKQLLAKHTVEEYFSKLESGNTPLGILRDTDHEWYHSILSKA